MNLLDHSVSFRGSAASGPVAAGPACRIPKIIHQTWKTVNVQAQFEKRIKSWIQRNPGNYTDKIAGINKYQVTLIALVLKYDGSTRMGISVLDQRGLQRAGHHRVSAALSNV